MGCLAVCRCTGGSTWDDHVIRQATSVHAGRLIHLFACPAMGCPASRLAFVIQLCPLCSAFASSVMYVSVLIFSLLAVALSRADYKVVCNARPQ